MEIGISTATYFGKLPTEDTFEYIKEAGANICEVFMDTFSEYTPEFGRLFKENSEKYGVKVYSVHASNLNYEPNLNNPTKRARDDSEVFYRQVLANGRLLNAKSYTYHGGTRLKRRQYTFDFEKLGKRIEELCGIAKEYGIDMSYETVHWAYFSYPEFFENLEKFSPSVKCTLDIKQVMQAGLNYRDFLPAMEGRINNVHLTDYDENGNILRPGKGIVDYYDLFSRLKGIGYDGPMMIELYSGNYDKYSDVKDCVDYLYDILGKVK